MKDILATAGALVALLLVAFVVVNVSFWVLK
jgi:hypothetical protein